MASNVVPITVAHGDGIGPEIMAASLHIIQEAGARIETETLEIGEKVYPRGINSGIEPSAWEFLRRAQVYPSGSEETFCTDHWRARFTADKDNAPVTHTQIVSLLDRLQNAGLAFIKIENLYTFDGQKGFVSSQGE